MAKNFIEDGDTIDWTNSTDQAVASGDLVALEGLCGVAIGDISPGSGGVLRVSGVFSLPKVDVEVKTGQPIFISGNGKLTNAATTKDEDAGTSTGNRHVGVAWADAAAAEASVAVRLGS